MPKIHIRLRVIPLFCILMSIYFIYHTIQGNRGLRRSWQLDQEIELARNIAKETAEEKKLMAAKVKSLSPASLDLDQLEESARRVLNMGNPNDRVIFD